MGQIATPYRVDKTDVKSMLDNFDIGQVEKGFETFQKTFEGLRYILSKNQDQETIELVKQIFYPEKYFGNEADYKDMDFENAPDDFDFGNDLVCYHDPEKVSVIHNFLNR